MQFLSAQGTGSAPTSFLLPKDSKDNNTFTSSAPPPPPPLASLPATRFITPQILIQHLAYLLSDKIFAHDIPTFGLATAFPDLASSPAAQNIHSYNPVVANLQTRTGAGALALGYTFSPDFDPRRRHIPQTLVAPSLALRSLRASLEQFALLHNIGSPLVAHVAAIDYQAGDNGGLVTEYDAALRIAEDIGLGLVASTTPTEVQHVGLLATLMAALLPTLHVYDGVRLAREAFRHHGGVFLYESAIAEAYHMLSDKVSRINKRLDNAGKALELFHLFNGELGTAYRPFEYHGHETAETVLVVFGSAEAQVARQVAEKLAEEGTRAGVVNVRLYRPFIEEAFFAALPKTTERISVLGQVRDDAAVSDVAIQSALFADVLSTVAFGEAWARLIPVTDAKYTGATARLTPSYLSNILRRRHATTAEAPSTFPSLVEAKQYILWDLDEAPTASSAAAIAYSLSSAEPESHVHLNRQYDNLVQGGAVRADIRHHPKASVDAPYAVQEADLVAVGDEKLLGEVDVVRGLQQGGALVLRLSGFKAEDAEKRIPAHVRRGVAEKECRLFALDTSYSPALEKDPQAARILYGLTVLSVARPDLAPEPLLGTLVQVEAGPSIALQEVADSVALCLHKVNVNASWAEAPAALQAPELRRTIQANSFAPHANANAEPEQTLSFATWREAAKGLVFKEAFGTQNSLRPELPVKTATVTVKENRRLTPAAYDRNIFHIEFDLGDSGLTYDIGEALGIHAENDEKQIAEFEAYYNVDPDALVRVPGREDGSVLQVRTVHQALVQNVDILGKPPKRFYAALAAFATDAREKSKLEALGGREGADELKRRSEIDTATYADVLAEFPSARPGLHDLLRIVAPLKRREYSIASAQSVTPTSVSLMIVVVRWVDPRGRTRHGQATSYLSRLRPGARVTVSVKPSVMKLPAEETAPLILAGLGTGLAPFRAFAQHRALQRLRGAQTGPILLYLGSRHQREEYLYGEEWEAYLASGVITLVGAAFSRDQKEKMYIQDRMRQTLDEIIDAYIGKGGSFYLCGPTWPVPDVTDVLKEAIVKEAGTRGVKVDAAREIERLKEEGRYVLEVY